MSQRKSFNWLLPVIILIILNIVFGCWYWFSNAKHIDIEKLKESVVKIVCYDIYGNEVSSASGVISHRNDEIVTNYHVIDEDACEFDIVLHDGTMVSVDSVIAYNEALDLAVLGLNTGLDIEPLEPESVEITTAPGDKVYTISSQGGEVNRVSEGVYEGSVKTGNNFIIKTTAPVSGGSSGGALFNQKGDLIGIIIGSENGNCRAAPATDSKDVLSKNDVSLDTREFYHMREHPAPLLTTEELLDNRQKYHGMHVTVRSSITDINEDGIAFAGEEGSNRIPLSVDINRINNDVMPAPGASVYATGLYLATTERDILHALTVYTCEQSESP